MYFKRNVPSVRRRLYTYAIIIFRDAPATSTGVLGVTSSVKGAFITVVFLLSTFYNYLDQFLIAFNEHKSIA